MASNNQFPYKLDKRTLDILLGEQNRRPSNEPWNERLKKLKKHRLNRHNTTEGHTPSAYDIFAAPFAGNQQGERDYETYNHNDPSTNTKPEKVATQKFETLVRREKVRNNGNTFPGDLPHKEKEGVRNNNSADLFQGLLARARKEEKAEKWLSKTYERKRSSSAPPSFS